MLSIQKGKLVYRNGNQSANDNLEIKVATGNITAKYLAWLEEFQDAYLANKDWQNVFYHKPTPDVLRIVDGRLFFSFVNNRVKSHGKIVAQVYDCFSENVLTFEKNPDAKLQIAVAPEILQTYVTYCRNSPLIFWDVHEDQVYSESVQWFVAICEPILERLQHEHLPPSNISLLGNYQFGSAIKMNTLNCCETVVRNDIECYELDGILGDGCHNVVAKLFGHVGPNDNSERTLTCPIVDLFSYGVDLKSLKLVDTFCFRVKSTSEELGNDIFSSCYQYYRYHPIKDLKQCFFRIGNVWVESKRLLEDEWCLFPKIFIQGSDMLEFVPENYLGDIYVYCDVSRDRGDVLKCQEAMALKFPGHHLEIASESCMLYQTWRHIKCAR